MNGIFDHNPGGHVEPSVSRFMKEDFDIRDDKTGAPSKGSREEKEVDKAIAAINGGSTSKTTSINKEDEAIDEITAEEEELAEQMIFKGFAHKDVVVPIFRNKGTTIGICTNSPQDMSIINHIMFNVIKENEDKDGNVNISEIEVTSLRNSYLIALSFMGLDRKDICEDIVTAKLSVLKAAIKKLNDLYASGDMDRANTLRNDIVKNVKVRSERIRQLPTPFIDFITEEKYKFESMMFDVIGKEAILPKS